MRCGAPQRPRKPPHIRHRPAFAVRPQDAFYAREVLLHFAARAFAGIIIDPYKMINASFAFEHHMTCSHLVAKSVRSIRYTYGLI